MEDRHARNLEIENGEDLRNFDWDRDQGERA